MEGSEARRKKLQKLGSKKSYDTLCCTTPENIYYFTGFWGNGILLMNENTVSLLTSDLEAARAKESSNCLVIKSNTLRSMLGLISRSAKKDKICFDDVNTSVLTRFQSVLGRNLIIDPEVFYSIRRQKDEGEIEKIADTARCIDLLFGEAASKMKEGLTEWGVAKLLIKKALDHDAMPATIQSSISPLIVASGPNSAYPHAQLTNRKLRRGDLIVLDIVLRKESYLADATRTFCIGTPSRKQESVYDAVMEAQKSTAALCKVGKQCGALDQNVRNHLKKSGLLRYFVHSTGHGVGLEVHETPWLRSKNKDRLKKGDVVTIEPGAYLNGRFGVRIEDTIALTPGNKNLTKFEKVLSLRK